MQRALPGEALDDVVAAFVVVPINPAHARVADGKLHQVAFDEIPRNSQREAERRRRSRGVAR